MSKIKQIAFVALAFTAGIVWQIAMAQESPRRMVQKWEYSSLENADKKLLQEAGDDGWELVTVTQRDVYSRSYFFKRPK